MAPALVPGRRRRFPPHWAGLFLAALLPGSGCAKKEQTPPQPARGREGAIILSQAFFTKDNTGVANNEVVPAPGRLVFVYREGEKWTSEIVEDPDSNVLHKAMPFDLPGEKPGILTIGAHQAPRPATLKVWRRTARGWKDTVLWSADFGGKFNRFRDVEIGDVDGDRQPDIVLATHDQGVVAVLRKRGDQWVPTEIDRAPATFVHEIEIGDLDGDGYDEIYATPSAPNQVNGQPQPGRIVRYLLEGPDFSRQVVDEFAERHVKEILIARLAKTEPPDLYAALEVQLGRPTSGEQVEIRRYRFTRASAVGTRVAGLPDAQCRFLNAGDVDGDGKPELIASGFKSGLWLIRPGGDPWETQLIDAESSGYEHATALSDLDGDGTSEIYVAADDQQKLRRYHWTGANFERTDVVDIPKGSITFGLTVCQDAQCLTPPQPG